MGQSGVVWAQIAGWIGSVMFGVYLAILFSQGDMEFLRVLPFALMMLLGSVAALVAVRVSSVLLARRLLITSTIFFGVIGFLGIFSIGLPFLLAGLLSAVGAVRVGRAES